MIKYITKQGDVLDWIVWKHYGTIDALEKVMEANQNITDEILETGVEINLPYIAAISNTGVKLWS